MKLISIVIMGLLMAGIGSAQNYLPESIMEPGASFSMFKGAPGNFEAWGGNVYNVTNITTDAIYDGDAIVYRDGSATVAKYANGTVISIGADADRVIDAARAAVGDGKTIRLKGGTYVFNSELEWSTQTNLKGSGWVATIIAATSDITPFNITSGGNIAFEDFYIAQAGVSTKPAIAISVDSPDGFANSIFRNLYIGSFNKGIEATYCTGSNPSVNTCLFDKIYVWNCTGTALDIENSIDSVYSHIMVGMNSAATGYGFHLVSCHSGNHYHNIVIQAAYSASIGFYLEGTSSWTIDMISDLIVDACNATGIYIKNCIGLDADGLYAYTSNANDNDGIYISGGGQSNFNNLQTRRCGGDGIVIIGGHTDSNFNNLVCIENAQYNAGHYHGLLIEHCSNSTFSNIKSFDRQANKTQSYGIFIWIWSYDNQLTNVYLSNNLNGEFVDVGIRTLIDGLGQNVGNPSSTGNWNGYGKWGATVVDTGNNTLYKYANGNWQQLN